MAVDTGKSRLLAREQEQTPESESEQEANQDYPQLELVPETLVVSRSWSPFLFRHGCFEGTKRMCWPQKSYSHDGFVQPPPPSLILGPSGKQSKPSRLGCEDLEPRQALSEVLDHASRNPRPPLARPLAIPVCAYVCMSVHVCVKEEGSIHLALPRC